jgi:hypothetical protein
MFSKLILTFGLLSSWEAFSVEFSPIRPIKIEAFNYPDFKASLPARDLYLDGKNRAWILGKSSLWMYELLTQQLVRIKIESLSHELQAMTIFGDKLFATNGRALYSVNLDDPSQIKIFESNLPASQDSRCMSADHEFVVWSHSNGIRFFDHKKNSFEDRTKVEGNVCGIVKNGKYFRVSNEKFLEFSPVHSPDQITRVEIPFSVSAMDQTVDSILVWSPSLLLRFSLDLQQRFTIPVNSQKRLVDAESVDSIQIYFYRDRTVEVNDNDAQSKRYYDLSGILKDSDGPLFRARKRIVAFSSKDTVQFIQLLDADK